MGMRFEKDGPSVLANFDESIPSLDDYDDITIPKPEIDFDQARIELSEMNRVINGRTLIKTEIGELILTNEQMNNIAMMPVANPILSDLAITTTASGSKWNRVLGGLQCVGGLIETAGGAALSTTWLGAVLGVPMAASGLDNTYTGAKEVWYGDNESTMFVRGMTYAGMSETSASLVQGGFDVFGDTLAGGAKAFRAFSIFERERLLNPNQIRFSQESISYLKNRLGKEPYTFDDITQSMSTKGWQGEAIDVVKMPEGGYTSLDNTRVLAARRAGIDVKANIHNYNEPLPSSMLERFEHPMVPGSFATTWGEALEYRIFRQSSNFQHSTFPLGTYVEPRVIYPKI